MQKTEVIFLGTSPIGLPLFYCHCPVCEEARVNSELRRTRASIAIVGNETTIIDPGPDMESQLEREAIDTIDNILITHWHYDHIAGLGTLREVSMLAEWKNIDVYVPEGVSFHFKQELAYIERAINIHPINVGDTIKLEDISLKVVKTTHTENSVGYIIKGTQQEFAYLIDSVIPPPKTIDVLKKSRLDFIVLEGTIDNEEKVEGFNNFTVKEAIDFWKSLDIEKCILTHLSCHRYKGKLVSGMLHEERSRFEKNYPGLLFAFDGLSLVV
ncbi:MAG: MBL fold metallo-hydrolase [Candidatus Hodarchaeales archaeon]